MGPVVVNGAFASRMQITHFGGGMIYGNQSYQNAESGKRLPE
jgi:hypothetical protein